MEGYLTLVVTGPGRRSALRPWSLFDLGHVDIVLCCEVLPAQSYGFYAATWWRVVLSALWPQKGRMIVAQALSLPRPDSSGRLAPALGNTAGARCRTWRLTSAQFHAVREHLEHIADQCRAGKQRYSALRFNCFHLAFRCLDVAGFRRQRRSRQWVVFVPTIGSESFCKDLMSDVTGTAHLRSP